MASRKEAATRGERTYFTGRPCLRGHTSPRSTSSGYCVECRRDREKQQYELNPEKAAAKARRRYERRSEHIKRKSSVWSKQNKQQAKATRQAYTAKNGTEINLKSRERAKLYRERFPDRAKAAVSKWTVENPEKVSAYKRNRRAWKRGNGGTHTADEVLEILKNQRGKCIYCPAQLYDKYHVDHIVPLSKKGRNDRRNLQLLCEPCNLSKGSKDPIEFSQQRGLLL